MRFDADTWEAAPDGFNIDNGELSAPGELGAYVVATIESLQPDEITWLVKHDMVDVDELIAALADRCLTLVLAAIEPMRAHEATKHLIDAAMLFMGNAREGSI